MPVIKKERFTFWIPAFDLMSKVNASIEKIIDCNIHDECDSKPSNWRGRNKFSFILGWVRSEMIKGKTLGMALCTHL